MCDSQLNDKKIKLIVRAEPNVRITEWQCDACPAGLSIMGENLEVQIDWEKSYIVSEMVAIPIDQNDFVVYGPYLHWGPIIINSRLKGITESFAKPQKLVSIHGLLSHEYGNEYSKLILEQMIKYNLIMPMYDSLPCVEEEIKTLTSLIHVTYDCNLSCDYCYIQNMMKNKDSISYKNGLGIIDSIFRSAKQNNFDEIKIKFTGGEPLIHQDRVWQLSEYALKKSKDDEQKLTLSLLTNGTLLNCKILQKIKSKNMLLMISLDGLENNHDIQRRFPDGSGTFNIVSQKIELALSEGVRPDISVTVTDRNAGGLKDLIYWLIEKDLQFSINFYRKPNFYSKNHSKIDKSPYFTQDIVTTNLLEAFEVLEEYSPKNSLLASLVDRANLSVPHIKSCSAGSAYFVFDIHGHLYKCQMKMDKSIGNYKEDDLLQCLKKSLIEPNSMSVTSILECRSCIWRHACAGGCPLERKLYCNDIGKKSIKCKVYKSLFPKVLYLEGLRLMKYGEDLFIQNHHVNSSFQSKLS